MVGPPVVDEAARSPGQPLDGGTRARFEPLLGHDFSRVRIHTGPVADEAARAVGARAYTLGDDVVFAAGRYAPATAEGQRLLAHELTHVSQQAAGLGPPRVQRDLAIQPIVSQPIERTLSEEDVRAAIAHNRGEFTDPYSLAVIRDVLGISRFPAVSDRDLALAVGRWQAAHGLAQDGRLGAVTVTYVIEELQAEGNDADAALLMLEFPRGTFLDVDLSFCQCRPQLDEEVADSTFFIGEYQACGSDPTNTTGDQIEACIQRRARAAGQQLTTAGTTSSSGQINVARVPGPCGPLLERITTAHEQIHSVHTRELQQLHGRGTKAFRRAFNDAADWVADEVNSRRTDIAVARWARGILDRICP